MSDAGWPSSAGGATSPFVPIAFVARWVLLTLARNPAVLTLSALLVLTPILQHSAHVGALEWPVEHLRPWLIPASWIGSALGMGLLGRHRWVLGHLGTARLWLSEWVALGAASLLLQLPILMGGFLSGASPVDMARLLPAILSTALHSGALALVLLSTSARADLRLGLLLLAAWLGPAFAAGCAKLHVFLAPLAPGLVLGRDSSTALLPALASAGALAAFALWLRSEARAFPG